MMSIEGVREAENRTGEGQPPSVGVGRGSGITESPWGGGKGLVLCTPEKSVIDLSTYLLLFPQPLSVHSQAFPEDLTSSGWKRPL